MEQQGRQRDNFIGMDTLKCQQVNKAAGHGSIGHSIDGHISRALLTFHQHLLLAAAHYAPNCAGFCRWAASRLMIACGQRRMRAMRLQISRPLCASRARNAGPFTAVRASVIDVTPSA